MAEDDDDSEKTEDPTHKRLEDALQKGQVPYSKELTNFLMLLALTLLLSWMAPSIMRSITGILSVFISRADSLQSDGAGLGQLLVEVFRKMGILMLVPVVATIVVALGSSFMQNGIVTSVEPIMPKLERISPIKGLGRMFSMRSLVEFIKGVLKIILVGATCYIAILPKLTGMQQLYALSIAGILSYMMELVTRMMIGVCIVMAGIAALDFLYQRFEYMKGLRMSKQDLKEEFKQSEGNPEIKAKLKAIRMERARKRMMAAVPTADVVITNPTHFAVALQYDNATMRAPKLVAKGQDKVALRIREIAEANDVPVVRNPTVARTLFAAVEIDEEVPAEHYKAVAEIISYVYRLKGKAAA